MRTSFFVLAAATLVLLTGCGEAVSRGFSEQDAPQSYGAVVDAGAATEAAAAPAVPTPSPGTYHVSGGVFGLAAGSTLVLENNGADDLTFVADARFTFPAGVQQEQPFAVTVKTQPAHQTCAVRHGHGLVGSANVTDVSVECGAVTFPIGGVSSNLHGTVVLQESGGDELTLDADGTFSFPTNLPPGSSYDVSVAVQPDGQQCVVWRATKSGTVPDGGVTSLVVGCTDFANASFASDFAGWTLTRDEVVDHYGGAATVASGTTLAQGDVIHERISDTDLTLEYVTSALPLTLTSLSASPSSKVALLCAANGPTRVTAAQDLTLSAAVTSLSFGLQYASDGPLDDAYQLVHVQLLDPTTNDVLTTLTSLGTASVATAQPSTITTDVSAYAGQTVRLQLEIAASHGPLYVGFDSFMLH